MAAASPFQPFPPANPVPDPTTVVHAVADFARVTVLRPGLLRVQLPLAEAYDDRPTYQVSNRRSLGPTTPFAVPVSSAALLVVATASAAVNVSADGGVVFSCGGGGGGGGGSSGVGWAGNAHDGAAIAKWVDSVGMPINRGGVYVLDDTDTMRLAGGDGDRLIDWWAAPLAPAALPPTPPPTPAVAPPIVCGAGHSAPGTDVAPGSTRVASAPHGLANKTQAACCATCAADPSCVAWVWAPSSSPTTTSCWPLASTVGTRSTTQDRVFGGAPFFPPGPPVPSAKQRPADLYLMCYGNGGGGGDGEEAEDDIVDYVVDYAEGAAQLAAITGAPPLMPAAAYGVWYSGCCLPSLYTSDAVRRDLLGNYSARDLPLDVFVLDFFWHRGADSGTWGGYSFDRARFPDGEALLAEMRDGSSPYGAPLITLNNHHPNGYEITAASEDRYAAFATAMGADPAAGANFSCNFYDRRYVTALQDALLAPVEDFPWVDCVTCSAHGDCGNKTNAALKSLDFNLHANYAFDALLARDGRRGLTLNRLPGRGDGSNYNDGALNGSRLTGNLGAHRFPGAWTGDIGDDSSKLPASIALFPAAFSGHLWGAFSVDLGPYAAGGLSLDFPTMGARFVRFVQWGVWSPVFRPHDGGNVDTRIWERAEPYAAALRDATRLRGALTPAVYTLAARSASAEAWPFIRPMWWDYGAAAESCCPGVDAWALPGQYMFGADVLVSPVGVWSSDPAGRAPASMNCTAINATSVSTWLPPTGLWYSWDGQARWQGGRTVTTVAQLEDTPLFVRAGAVVPLWPPGRRAVAPELRTRVWALWADGGGCTAGGSGGGCGNGTWYEDDGATRNYTAVGAFAMSTLGFEATAQQLTATVRTGGAGYAGEPANRTHALQLRGGRCAPSQAACHTAGSTTELTRSDAKSWTSQGWWVQGVEHAEMAVPAGAVVVVCPAVAKSDTLTITVSWEVFDCK